MWNTIKKSLVVNLLFVCVLAGVAYGTYSMVRRTLVVRTERRTTDERVQELIRKKETLEIQLRELETREVAEREAKERLNLKNRGEEVVVVLPETNHRESVSAKPAGVWERIRAFISLFIW